MPESANTVWTIGHSTRSIEDFISLLQAFDIQTMVDVRHFPGSRKFPQYNKEALAASLAEQGINYAHIIELVGGESPIKIPATRHGGILLSELMPIICRPQPLPTVLVN